MTSKTVARWTVPDNSLIPGRTWEVVHASDYDQLDAEIARLLPMEQALARSCARQGELMVELGDARRTSEYWKAEHLAGNMEIQQLRHDLEKAIDGRNGEAREVERLRAQLLQHSEVCKEAAWPLGQPVETAPVENSLVQDLCSWVESDSGHKFWRGQRSMSGACIEAADEIARLNELVKAIQHETSVDYDKLSDENGRLRNAFKNFHHVLCERFGYCHDEADWERDQISLIEWIAKRLPAETAAPTTLTLNGHQIRSIMQFLGGEFDTEATIGYFPEERANPEGQIPMPAGHYVWCAEYPEEGSWYLNEEPEFLACEHGVPAKTTRPCMICLDRILSSAPEKAREPLPPEVLANALQDVVHKDLGAARAARSVKTTASHE